MTKPVLELFQFILNYSIFGVPDAWLFCIVINLVICISVGLLYIFVILSPGFGFCFLSTSQEMAGKSSS